MLTFNKCFIQILQAVLLVTFFSSAYGMERRRDQFIKEPGHYIIPLPISLPGIGDALSVLGVISNANDSYTDYAAFVLAGDIEGFGATVTDLHLIDRTLTAEVAMQKIGKVAINSYDSRGMQDDKDDFSILELDEAQTVTARLRGIFYDRMIEFQALAIQNEYHLANLRNKDGNLILDTSGSETNKGQVYSVSMQLDWTDDFQDPRKGIRYGISRWWTDDKSIGSSEFYQQEHNLTAYIPIGRISTWAFNYFISDAFVTRVGDTDFTSVENRLGLDCNDLNLSALERTKCQQVVNNTIAHNRYGTAASMGGTSRLRSYPEGRYSGAHTKFYGTEFRWNLSEEYKPFNIGIAKDIRTGVQIAFFWERATVADEKDKLGDIWRDSYGIGARLITTSGLVFRAEIATGDEGVSAVVFFNYPWADF